MGGGRARRGFTLVETLAAGALSALLLLAAFKMVAALARDRHTVHFPSPPSAVPALLRTDLQGASDISFGETSLTLTGPLSLQPRHLPARVSYQVEMLPGSSGGGRRWLTRTQQLLTSPPSPPTRELLVPDVVLFQVARVSGPTEDSDKPPPIPRQVLLSLQSPSETFQATLTLY